MMRLLLILLVLVVSVWSQSSLDILTAPNNSRSAGLGLSTNPVVKPTRVITHPQGVVDLSVWNWVSDIQGGTIGVHLKHGYVSFQAMHSGDIENRDDIPTEEPLSTFRYTLFNTGGAYARQFGAIILGLGGEYIYERTLNASAGGLSLNISAAYSVSERLLLSTGLSHVGFTQNLDTESTELPTDAWFEIQYGLSNMDIHAEFNTSEIPLVLGASYPLFGRLELLGGLQIEPADPDLAIHPSAGFTANWDTFILGYSIYQIEHNLGPRHFVSLYWNY